MAFSSTIQPSTIPAAPAPKTDFPDVLLSLTLLTALAASGSKQALRKLKTKLFWTGLKLKFKSLFSKKDSIPTKTLIYILLGVVLLALLFIDPLLTLAIAVIALIILLLTKSF